jgi:hypothetical protein
MFLRAILSGLILFSAVANGADLAGLQQARYEKLKELSELGQAVIQKRVQISNIDNEVFEFFIRKAERLNFSEDQQTKMIEQINILGPKLIQKFKNHKNNDWNLNQELFFQDDYERCSFRVTEFWSLMDVFEYELLKILVSKYEKCLCELIDIENKLEANQS